MAITFYRFMRALRSMCAPITAVIGFSFLLTIIFVLYQPTPGPGVKQRLGWQSWEVITMPGHDSTDDLSIPSTGEDVLAEDVDWWDVTAPDGVVDSSSLPLDVWAPLMPHDTGLSEIAVAQCVVDPRLGSEFCMPASTPEEDAIRGKWVLVDRNLNMEGGYLSGYLSIYYRRTRRQDINLITDIAIFPPKEEPTPIDGWTKVPTSLRTGRIGTSALYLWFRTGKTAYEMSPEERSQIITELDVLYGDDAPWYGFETIDPPTMDHDERRESTRIAFRRGVKNPPRAPPLHFSHSGKFKVMQIADLHFSVSQGVCRDTLINPCTAADNLTNSLLGRMLSEEKPDLVVFSGDQLNGQGTSWDPKSVLAKFAKEVTARNIPWAAVFGNHDEENGATKEEQLQMMKGLPYSLVEPGPKDLHGVGNYVLKVKSADASKTHLLTLYFLDSGSYSAGFVDWWGFFTPTEYDWIHQDQIDWFLQESAAIKPIERPFTPDSGKDFGNSWKARQEQVTPDIRKLAKPNAMVFFHIPLPETYNEADSDPRTGKALDVGMHDLETHGNSKKSDGFFEKAILQAPETAHVGKGNANEVKVIGNGHSHITENCRRVKGVWMCFGGGGSYSGYSKVGFDRRFRIYEISDYGETIKTYKRTEKDEIIDEMVLTGKGAAPLS